MCIHPVRRLPPGAAGPRGAIREAGAGMTVGDGSTGAAELRRARASGGLFGAVVLFSVAVNLLMLAGPLYMLLVHDRVLTSRSEPTLVALSALVAGLFAALALLDMLRVRILVRLAARFQARLDRRVFAASVERMAMHPGDPVAAAAPRDLETVRRTLASPVVAALIDLPWTPVFVAVIFVFHPALGWISVAGGAALAALTLANRQAGRAPAAAQDAAQARADHAADRLRAESETLRALGMTGAAVERWHAARAEALVQAARLTEAAGANGAAGRSLRLFLQSAVLGLGAWLVLRGEIGAGAMVAASILLGRALAPVELAIGQWPLLQQAQDAWQRLALLLSQVPPAPTRTELPRPRAVLEVAGLTVVAPGEASPALRGLSFRLDPGQALGVIGPSGSGKSTLARALTGVWRPTAGHVRLDGATPGQFAPDRLGRLIGYLPQRVTLFEGTVAENIARLDAAPDATAVVAAARAANAHDMILRLPGGYDTPLDAMGGRLSGGQIQRIGLARALYGDPVLLILDEPNAHLDNDGAMALNAAVRTAKSRGAAVIVMAHRPAALQECELLLMLQDGARAALGPRDQVLRDMVRNAGEVVRQAGTAGVA